MSSAINSFRPLQATATGDVTGAMVNNALSCSFEEFFEKIPNTDPDGDYFQNLMVPSLPKDTSLAKFS